MFFYSTMLKESEEEKSKTVSFLFVPELFLMSLSINELNSHLELDT